MLSATYVSEAAPPTSSAFFAKAHTSALFSANFLELISFSKKEINYP
jgi:hypothetical protein